MMQIDPLALAELDRGDRFLALDPWHVPERVTLDLAGYLVWDPDGPRRRVVADRTLLDRFAKLAGATDRAIVDFVNRWGPLGERRPLGFADESPQPEQPSPDRLAVVYRPDLVPPHLLPAPPSGREWIDEWRIRAREVAAALRIARALEEGRLGDESSDWRSVAPGRWRQSYNLPGAIDEPLPDSTAPSEPAKWHRVDHEWTTVEDQRRYLAWHVSRWLAEANVRPRLALAGEGFAFRLTTGGVAGAVAAELAFRVGDLRAFGEPCAGGCGRWLSPRRRRSDEPKCRWCTQREASARYRTSEKYQRARAQRAQKGAQR